ncbi:helix-turn-helix domain-containing protein [Aerococcaceae bacterium NML190073]|nr:helix-turn-helix domain-containing protein [Aerococcaceae bacterium NML190073]
MARGKYQEWLTKDGLLMLESWARDGLTDEQIANKIGVDRTTFYVWLKKYPDISDAIKKGKAPVDAMVENALLKRALGFEYEETEVIKDTIGEGIDKQERTRIKKVKKYAPPDTGAIIFWLKNRKPDTWRKMSSEMKQKIEAEAKKLEAEAKRLEAELAEMSIDDETIVIVDAWEDEDSDNGESV